MDDFAWRRGRRYGTVRDDVEAVYAGVALPWSNGQVGGQVHRLKLLTCSMYGRASFALLQKPGARRGVSTPCGPSSPLLRQQVRP